MSNTRTAIPAFSGKDAHYYSAAEVADIMGVQDGARWLSRRKVATIVRKWNGKRITLAHPADVFAAR